MGERDKRVEVKQSEIQNPLVKKIFGDHRWVIYPEPTTFDLEGDLHDRVRLAFLTRGPRDFETELQLSDDLYDTYIAGLSRRRAIPAYLDLMSALREIHIPLERRTKPRSVYTINRIQGNLVANLAVDHAEKVSDRYLAMMRIQAGRLPDTEAAWYYPKLSHLEIKMREIKTVYEWIAKMKKRIDIKSLDADSIREAGDEILDQLYESRGYGLKNCFAPSPLFLEKDEVFTFFDERLSIDHPANQILPRDMLGYVALTYTPDKVQTPEVELVGNKSRTISSYHFHIDGLQVMFGVDSNGDLKTGVDSVPIRRVFERKGAEGLYELLRLFNLARFLELTERPELVKKGPSVVDIEEELMDKKKGKIKEIPYKTLVVPRAKPDEYPPREDSGRKRFVDKHKVTWHIRRLPGGYHATKEAVAYAKNHKVTLEDGETIVREHWRGQEKENGSSHLPTKAIFTSR